MKIKYEDIIKLRLANQQISLCKCKTIHELVSLMCAVQAQDYASAKYALGLRLNGTTDEMLEKAISNKEIIRTWPVRNTLHFVSASDIRWLLAIEAVEKNSIPARMMQLGYTKKLLSKCRNIIEKSLDGKKELTRSELLYILNNKGLKLNGRQLYHLLARLAKEQLICLGSNKSKQVTFTLLDNWVPNQNFPERKELLGWIAKRYFQTRGPATISDFSWWSGLKISDSKAGIQMIKDKLESAELNGDMYYMAGEFHCNNHTDSDVHLLPWFDEYIVSYKKRDAIIPKEEMKKVNAGGGMINPVILIKGKIAGVWKREIKKDTVYITIRLFRSISRRLFKLTEKEIEKYASFLGKTPGGLVINLYK